MERYENTTVRIAPPAQPCALVQDLLPLYMEGEVSPASSDLIGEHLARCERCAGFLAGAQSVRGQLAIERRARASAGAAAQPDQRAVLRWRAALAGVAAFIICAIGGGASALLTTGEGGTVFGMFIGSVALSALLLLARVVAPLDAARLAQLGTSVLTGILSGIVLGGSGSEGLAFAGLLLGLVATGTVCAQIVRAAASAAPAAVSG